MEPRLIQSQSQQLILSPQLKQYLKLLQLPIMELQLNIQEELAQNPVLEEVEDIAEKDSASDVETSPEVSEKELLFDQKIDQLIELDQDFRDSIYHQTDLSDAADSDTIKRRNFQETLITEQPTLSTYLEWQLGLLSLSGKEREIAIHVIGNINDDGYFVSTIEDVAKETNTSPDAVDRILKLIQTLDPPGVGGRNLSEVLSIQLKRQKASPLAIKIAESHLPLLQKKQYDTLAHLFGLHPDQINHACQVISKLEPKPGRIFYQNESISVVPDLVITKNESEDAAEENAYEIEVNNESIPSLRISNKYRQLLKQKNLEPKTKLFLRERMQAALLFVRAIGERKSTLRRIGEELVKFQRDFLDRGFSYLKPLRLKDVAEKLGIHESTISRAVQGKYVQCPQGTIPLKSFFSSSMTMLDGSIESQKSLVEKVKSLVDAEDKKKPLSDAKIVEMLKAEGIDIARRTITKYREILKILPTHLRKER